MPVTGGDGAGERVARWRQLVVAGSAPGKDLLGLLSVVCRIAADELAESGVGVSVMTEIGVRGVSAASDASSERLESLQFTLGEGPCLDAFTGRRPVLVADLSGLAQSRWPVYAAAVYESGVRAVFAFPLQIGAARLGAMDIFRRRAGSLTAVELTTALGLADLVVEVLLDWQEDSGLPENSDPSLVLELGDRAQLFQAQGMIMVQLGIPLAEALIRMRAYAFAHNRRLDEVARDIANGTLRLDSEQT